MNLVDITVIEVITEPYQLVNGMWTTVVKTDCYGNIKEQTYTRHSKRDVDIYVVGYTWLT